MKRIHTFESFTNESNEEKYHTLAFYKGENAAMIFSSKKSDEFGPNKGSYTTSEEYTNLAGKDVKDMLPKFMKEFGLKKQSDLVKEVMAGRDVLESKTNEGFSSPAASDLSNSWMRPHGDYTNRSWLLPNYTTYQNQKQSNARFSIGETVCCIDPMKESYRQTGKIIAFEDNTIRWEVSNSATGVGQTAKQYRCHAAALEKVLVVPGTVC